MLRSIIKLGLIACATYAIVKAFTPTEEESIHEKFERLRFTSAECSGLEEEALA